jgi:hypothetical protein
VSLIPTPSFGWRTLHVERDRMSGESYPSTLLFVNGYAAAQLNVAYDTGQDSPSCDMDTNLEQAEMLAFVTAWKGSVSTAQYWCVIVCGAWCGTATQDLDPPGENAQLGTTIGTRAYSWVFHETIRRAYQQGLLSDVALAKKRVALHESGHQFRPSKEDTPHPCIMHIRCPVQGTSGFCTDCATEIRTEGHPGP